MGSKTTKLLLLDSLLQETCVKNSAMASIEGVWAAQDLKVQIKGDGENTWRVSAKVANTMNCKVTKSGEAFSAGPVMGTKMMPVPRLEEREKEVNGVLSGLTSISIEGSQLKIASASASLLLDPSQE